MFSSRGSSNPGVEPTSPALAGGFLTTELPGKPQAILLVNSLFLKNELNLATFPNVLFAPVFCYIIAYMTLTITLFLLINFPC